VPVQADPITTGQVQEQCPVKATGLVEVDILDRGRLPQFGGACACLEALLLTQRGFLVDQQTEPFGVFEGAAFGIGREIAEPRVALRKGKSDMALPGKALKSDTYVDIPPLIFVLRFRDDFWGWNADRIPELFIGEVVLPEQVDVAP
jgi:hypothetical protein